MRVYSHLQSYRPPEPGSPVRATYMLLARYRFPIDLYDPGDRHVSADHDRLRSGAGIDVFNAALKRVIGTGDTGIGQWARETAPNVVLAGLVELMAHAGADPRVPWTGFRVCLTVNRTTGAPVYHLELFAQGPDSEAPVVDGDDAHAVAPISRRRARKAGFGSPKEKYRNEHPDPHA